jgi:hypothetical protein
MKFEISGLMLLWCVSASIVGTLSCLGCLIWSIGDSDYIFVTLFMIFILSPLPLILISGKRIVE